MNDFEKQQQIFSEVLPFTLPQIGDTITLPSGGEGIVTDVSAPSNGLYVNWERATVTIWRGTDKAARDGGFVKETHFLTDLFG